MAAPIQGAFRVPRQESLGPSRSVVEALTRQVSNLVAHSPGFLTWTAGVTHMGPDFSLSSSTIRRPDVTRGVTIETTHNAGYGRVCRNWRERNLLVVGLSLG